MPTSWRLLQSPPARIRIDGKGGVGPRTRFVRHPPAVPGVVDAGDVAWAFHLPQPTVTYTPPVPGVVNAGDVAWSFDVPQPTVTYTPAPTGTVEQIIQLLAPWYYPSFSRWIPPSGSRPAIDAGLRGTDSRFLQALILADGEIRFRIASSQTQSSATGQDLTSQFEQTGSLEPDHRLQLSSDCTGER